MTSLRSQRKRKTLRLPRSITVSVSGSDGSGKTSTCTELLALLEALGLHATYHWQRPGSSPMLAAIKKLTGIVPGGRRSFARDDPAPSTVTKNKRSPGLLKRTVVIVVGADYLMRSWVQVIRARFTRGIHIFDRFLVDAAVDVATWYATDVPSWMLRFGPRVKRAVLLEVSPQVSASRTSTPAFDAEATAGAYQSYLDAFDVVVRDAESATEAAETIARSILDVFGE